MSNYKIYKKILPDCETFVNHYKMSKFKSTPCSYKKILKYNEDVLDYVYTSCKYGVHGGYKLNYKKGLSFLVMADLHGGYERLRSAIYYLNKIERVDNEGYKWIEKEYGVSVSKEENKKISLGTCSVKESVSNG